MKKRVLLLTLALCLLLSASARAAQHEFTDDDGRLVAFDAPFARIISLYSAHTENLYLLGAGDKLIGAHATSVFPPEAAQLPQFDYNADPEYIIAAQPDLVLIRPFITNRNPDFVKAIEAAGIQVVSMLPETVDDLDDYVRKLALLTGTEAACEELLSQFHASVEAVARKTADFAPKMRVFFESTENELRTVTPDSMAGRAIVLAGGVNVAADAQPVSEGSTVAAFGAERILMLADQIDVYVSQRGAMNAGGDEHSIAIRPGFETVKAVKEGRVYLINEKLISSPLLRYAAGVEEMARFLYPEQMDDLAAYQTDRQATRRDLANIVVRARHLPAFVPSSSKYYTQAHKGHVYGWFEDLPWRDADFNYVETAVQAGFVEWVKGEDGKEYFLPEEPVTREALARAAFLMGDFAAAPERRTVLDLESCQKPAIVQNLVDNGVFSLEDGRFNPQRPVTCAEIVAALRAANASNE